MREKTKPIILGTGIFNLDSVVVRDYPEGPEKKKFIERVIVEEVGGTCGNVMCILSHYGWTAMPVAVFDETEEGLKMASSLNGFGCDCRFVKNVPGGGTTTLKVTHKQNPDGSHKVSVRAGSPGGSRFPKRHFLRRRDEAPAFLEALDVLPDVFFYDDPAAGHRLMASELRSKGVLVYFEPSRIKEKIDYESISLSDIVKFSGENINDVLFTEGYSEKLFIQTLGAEGLRFNLRGEGWITLPPVNNPSVLDWEGAGDWTTSAFLNALAEADCLNVNKLTTELVCEALKKSQEVASQSVSFMGSKGMIRRD